MNYLILDDKGSEVARFQHKSDRDFCLGEMTEYYGCEFTKKDLC